MLKRSGWFLIGIGLVGSVVSVIPLTGTPPISRWWVYLFSTSVSLVVWGVAFLVPLRFRTRALVFAGVVTVWGAIVGFLLGRAPIYF
jgi:hypothetical protein